MKFVLFVVASAVSPENKRLRIAADPDAEFLAMLADFLTPLFPPTSYGGMLAVIHDRVSLDQFGCSRAVPSDTRWGAPTELVPRQVVDGAGSCGEKSEIVLESFIGTGGTCKVYSALQGRVAVKYASYCPSVDDPVDPILIEALMLDVIAQEFPTQRVANRLVYFSGVLEAPAAAGKVAVERCDDSAVLPAVRFLITEQVGINLWKYVSPLWATGAPRWPLAGQVGIQIFEMLRLLHAKNIVHGDVHMGNVALDDTVPGKLILIDFGRGRIIDPVFDAGNFGANAALEDNPECDALFTPWTMVGMQTSFRDDAYRTLLMMAQILHGHELMTMQDRLCTRPSTMAAYKHIKRRVNLFDYSAHVRSRGRSHDYRFSLERVLRGTAFEAKHREIGDELGRLLDDVRALDPFARPDFKDIVETLQRLVVA